MFPLYMYLLLISLISCGKEEEPPQPPDQIVGYETVPLKKPVTAGIIDEVSGIAPGFVNPGLLWTIEDSDRPTELGLLDNTGAILKKIPITGVTNRDWEDMTTGNGPEPGVNYIYIADIGDNAKAYTEYYIYRMKEPASSATKIDQADKIAIAYPDGSHDAEAMLIDRATKDLYIITKQDEKSKVYKLAFPYRTDLVNPLVFVSDLGYNLVTAVDLSPDGKEMLIRTYGAIYHYTIPPGTNLSAAFAITPEQLQHEAEIQGESICFATDQSGFYTISEKFLSNPVSLNFYKKK